MSNHTETRSPEKPDDANAMIVLTRKRWDWYFVFATAVAAVLGLVFSLVLNSRSALFCPLGLIALWLWLRFQTPPGGNASTPDFRDSRRAPAPRLAGVHGSAVRYRVCV